MAVFNVPLKYSGFILIKKKSITTIKTVEINTSLSSRKYYTSKVKTISGLNKDRILACLLPVFYFTLKRYFIVVPLTIL